MRFAAFFKLYNICALLHRSKLNIFTKNCFKRSAILVKCQHSVAHLTKICKSLPNFKFQLDTLVDLSFCSFFQNSANAYLLANIGDDTAENEQNGAKFLTKGWQNVARLPGHDAPVRGLADPAAAAPPAGGPRRC